MSLEAGRTAIERYFQANWVYSEPLGMDGHPFTASAGSVRLTIKDGARMQGTIGRVQNVVNRIGTLTAQIFTAGGIGSSSWRIIGDRVIDLTHNITIDASGAVVTSASQTALVRFSPPELGDAAHPYIAADIDEAPFRQTNIICPFVVYELR